VAIDAKLGRASVAIRATLDQLDSDLAGARKKVDGAVGRMASSAGRAFQGLGKVALAGGLAAVTGAVAGVAAVVHSTLPLAQEFQDQLAGLSIAASSSGLSLDELHDAALSVGGDTRLLGVSATGAADSMTGLYKAGLSTTEIFGDLQGYMAGTAELGGALRAAIDLAAATELDMVKASDLAAVALATFGGELETEAERAEFINSALNNMVQAADASVAEVTGLAEALKSVGPTASSMGISIEDTNNALAILSTRGIQGAEAGTSLKSMLANMRRPTDTVTEALDDLNVSLYDAEGVFVGLPNLIEQMQDSMAGLTDEQRDQYVQTLAGTYGMNALNTLLAEGTEGWDAMAAATAGAAGIQEQAAIKAGTFSGMMEGLGGTIETLKIGIGEAFLPVAQDLIGTFGNIVADVGPRVAEFFEQTLAPALEAAATFVGTFVTALLSGEDPVAALQAGLAELGLDQVAETVGMVVERVTELWDTLQPYVETVAEWIGQNIELQDVLIAVGIAIATVVVPAVISLVASASPILLVLLALIGIVAGLRAAWEKDFLGMRTAITNFWENSVEPAFEAVVAWLQVNIPVAIQAAADFWENTLKPALETVWGFIEESVIPIIEDVVGWLKEKIPEAIEKAGDFWENTLKPALETVWGFIQENVIPIFETVVEWLATNIPKAIEMLSDLWENTLKPALELVWKFVDENLVPLFEAIVELFDVALTLALTALAGLWENVLEPALKTVWKFIKENLQPVFDTLKEFLDDKLKKAIEGATPLLDGVKGALDKIAEAIQPVIDFIKDLTEKIKNINLPDWLTPGSPTPFELGLRGIGEAMRTLARTELPRLSAELRQVYEVEAVTRPEAEPGIGGRQQVVIYGLTLEGVQDASGLLGELQAMAI